MKTLRTWTVSACLCLLVASVVTAQAPDTKETVEGASNYVRLDANFASGGVTTAEAFVALKKLGFRTVVNLRTATEPGADLAAEEKLVSAAGLRYVGLPFAPAAPDLTAVEGFLQVAKDQASQPVYIHCQAGHRANAFWLIKRVAVDGWTTEKALAEADSLKMTNQRLRDFAIAYLKDR
jgi:uncharacterized protein (TIGR01244 family)